MRPPLGKRNLDHVITRLNQFPKPVTWDLRARIDKAIADVRQTSPDLADELRKLFQELENGRS